MKLPQLHIRDLFWLVLVVALGLGWFADRRVLVQHILGLQKHVDANPDKRFIRIHAWPY